MSATAVARYPVLMSWLNIVLYIYGFINIAGGVIGFVVGKSPWSLAIGATFGVLVLLLTSMTKSKPAMAYRTLGVLSIALLGFWIFRINEVMGQGKSPGMAIMNAALSLVVFALLGISHMMAVGKRKAEGLQEPK